MSIAEGSIKYFTLPTSDDIRVWRDSVDPNRVNFTPPGPLALDPKAVELDDPRVNDGLVNALTAYHNAIERAADAAIARTEGDPKRVIIRTFQAEPWRTEIVVDGAPAFDVRGKWIGFQFFITTTEPPAR
jgi:hypothetical protein